MAIKKKAAAKTTKTKTTTKKASAKKTTTKKATTTKATVAKAAPAKEKKPISIDSAKRHDLIALNAYLLAEKRGFEDGNELSDWLEAERIVDRSAS